MSLLKVSTAASCPSAKRLAPGTKVHTSVARLNKTIVFDQSSAKYLIERRNV
ncbi:hypothetical protein ABTM28_20235 [Acinetobacter baumannii]